MSSFGNVKKDGLIPNTRPRETDALPTPHQGVQDWAVQNWDLLSLHPHLPTPWSEQRRSAAISTDAAHLYRRTWWPSQDLELFGGSSFRDHTVTTDLLLNAPHHAAHVTKPPREALGKAPRVLSLEESNHRNRTLPLQQVGDNNKCSTRPAAASAAWAVHQQDTSYLDSTSQQCCQKSQESLLEGEPRGCRQLEDGAWPPLQAASTAQQRQQPAQQQQQRKQPSQQEQQQQRQKPAKQQQQEQEQEQEQQKESTQQQQQQQHQAQAETALPRENTDQLQQEMLRESQASKHPEHAQPQQQRHCSPGVAAEEQQDGSSASCSVTVFHDDQGIVNPLTSTDAVLHLAPPSHPPGACMDAVGPFPRRPGQTSCDFYVRTGCCKFGQSCKFDHPVHFAVCLNNLGLPLRAQEATCPFYAKTGVCKFGPSCKFDHPEEI